LKATAAFMELGKRESGAMNTEEDSQSRDGGRMGAGPGKAPTPTANPVAGGTGRHSAAFRPVLDEQADTEPCVGLRSIVVGGEVSFFAVLETDLTYTAYRHGQEWPLYGRLSDLVADLRTDHLPGSKITDDVLVSADVDKAMRIVSTSMTNRHEGDVFSAWMMLDDAALVLGFPWNFQGQPENRVFGKLEFRAMKRLPRTQPAGERYNSEWTEEEVAKIRQVLADGARQVLESRRSGERVPEPKHRSPQPHTLA
jgi:hypothetical protein